MHNNKSIINFEVISPTTSITTTSIDEQEDIFFICSSGTNQTHAGQTLHVDGTVSINDTTSFLSVSSLQQLNCNTTNNVDKKDFYLLPDSILYNIATTYLSKYRLHEILNAVLTTMMQSNTSDILLPFLMDDNFNQISNITVINDLNLTKIEWDILRMIIVKNLSYIPPPILTQGPIYCNSVYLDIANAYKRNFHGYLSMIICIFGTIANLANMAVLTRKHMSSAPINRVLTSLAFTDMLVMLEYIPFVYYHNIIFQTSKDFTYGGAVFILFHMNFSNILHTISICLTIALAIWRYISIRYPDMTQILCTDRRCTYAIIISYVLPIILCIPYYFTFTITSKYIYENHQKVILYIVDISELARRDNDRLFIVSFWLYSVIFKLLPCFILTVISFYLIRALYKTKKRKEQLRHGYDLTATDAKSALAFVDKRGPSRSERRADRTTRMLVAVLLLFLITELPQGIMGLLSVLLGKEFFTGCYNKFGEILDILALLNGAINFILYCSMSKQFRTTFSNMFIHRIRLGNFTSTQTVPTSVQNTYV